MEAKIVKRDDKNEKTIPSQGFRMTTVTVCEEKKGMTLKNCRRTLPMCTSTNQLLHCYVDSFHNFQYGYISVP